MNSTGVTWLQQLFAGLLLMLFPSIHIWAQTCNSAIPRAAPDSRYIDNANGTVTDLYTGLMWQQCSAGRTGSNCATGALEKYSWGGALLYVVDLNATTGFANHFDWRLPNVKELFSLVDETCNDPAINLNYFPNTNYVWHWSSTPHVNNSNNAWFVSFGGSLSDISRYQGNLVRLVRSVTP